MIRLARPDESEAVTQLVNAAYTPYIARNGKAPGPMLDDYAALIAQQRVHILVCNADMIGVVVLIPEERTLLLDNVAVRPGQQGRGIGKRLIAFAEQQALQAGYPAIRLYTQEIMTENVALYLRLGFVETHRGREKNLDRVYMTKSLGAL